MEVWLLMQGDKVAWLWLRWSREQSFMTQKVEVFLLL
jgi:hypothetical protein